MREMATIDNLVQDRHYTSLLYCPPGVGKSTAIGLIAEAQEGKTLVLDVDRTISNTLAKKEIVKDTSKVMVWQVDNINTFADWTDCLKELEEMRDSGELANAGITTVAVDNISELERCILSNLGMLGKNKGVPAQADYQYMQFKLVNSLRLMKSLNLNVVWTAWEDVRNIVAPDGTSYSQLIPKMSLKIVDNICGLCDVVGKIFVNKDGEHGILLEARQNIYAKNQIDNRKFCKVEDFMKFG
jgi:phage nucleotide-binding protein